MERIEIVQSEVFADWLRRLRDPIARSKIVQRIDRVGTGLLGDTKPAGPQVTELRIDYGPGYRLYFTWRGRQMILLLCGGDKGSQDRDIVRAAAMLKQMRSAT